jgi:transposase, IS30 family
MRERSYRRLREEDRFIIYRMRKAAISQSEIAQALGLTQSMISKELKRNQGEREYWAHEAKKKARERKKQKRHRGCVTRGQLERAVRERLERKHSPEQISGSLRSELRSSTSTTSIYNYINADKKNGGQLYKDLRIHRNRSYRHHNKEQRPKMPARIGIKERPQAVERRARYGDWEADLIAVSRGNLLKPLRAHRAIAKSLLK